MEVLFQICIDVAHNYENPCRSIKMMFRNDIDALRSLGFESFLLAPVFTKKSSFLRKAQIIKENQAFSLRRAF